MITSNPAICDHFKSGQRSRTQDMKLFYRADACSGKLFSVALRCVLLDPDQREGAEASLFFLLRKVFVLVFDGVAGAKPPRGAGWSPGRVGPIIKITAHLPVSRRKAFSCNSAQTCELERNTSRRTDLRL